MPCGWRCLSLAHTAMQGRSYPDSSCRPHRGVEAGRGKMIAVRVTRGDWQDWIWNSVIIDIYRNAKSEPNYAGCKAPSHLELDTAVAGGNRWDFPSPAFAGEAGQVAALSLLSLGWVPQRQQPCPPLLCHHLPTFKCLARTCSPERFLSGAAGPSHSETSLRRAL